jgi:SpoVK/Ycf46/Vps4 family AAA+-type ATPase
MELPNSNLHLNFSITPLVSDENPISEDVREKLNEIKACLSSFADRTHDLRSAGERTKRLRALFYGPSGNHIMLTAAFLAKDMRRQVYRINVGELVSKYTDETEKNLELLLAHAQDEDWILFFDEADALFGNRTSVTESHDRYANTDISYLLERIEEYNGLIILASNRQPDTDTPFITRFHCIVEFDSPRN